MNALVIPVVYAAYAAGLVLFFAAFSLVGVVCFLTWSLVMARRQMGVVEYDDPVDFNSDSGC